MSRRHLSPARERALRTLYPDGGWKAVAAAVPGWSRSAIFRAVQRRGIERAPGWRKSPKPKACTAGQRSRRCLKCGEDFVSHWNGERLCTPCKNRLRSGPSEIPIESFLVSTGRVPSAPGAP